ncbi:MAG: hypothetical protein QOF37_1926 [Thermoleophilaceae bacterium]|nr:hypothetical protein [Thermoleophilaceae bacterium]
MSLKRAVNAALVRATGYQLQKPMPRRQARLEVGPVDRLLEKPTFILCTVRSGSTLLRVLLNSHSQIHSPQEMHMRDIGVKMRGEYSEKSLAEIGLDERRLEYLLWDRMLHRELAESGKRLLVNKTPSDVLIVDRILECWPDARFVYLLRHPGAIARSRHAARPQDTAERNTAMVLRYAQAVEDARRAHPGHSVRYEDLAADPEAETRRLCEFLGVPWEPAMLDYGEFDHGRFLSGLGDWSEKIKSGRVQPASEAPPEEQTPPELREIAEAWGYLPDVRAGRDTTRRPTSSTTG